MKTIEEKAKAYDRALEIAKAWCKLDNNDLSNDDLETLFPELRESEDERVRQRFINLVKMSSEVGGFALHKWEADEMLAWLEKQGEMDMKSYKAAEDEKREFVGDGFIKCYADFQDFKEGETYWLEYVGNDNYNVRSDNLLGKTYHITPCQLYTIFKKMTWLEKQGEKKPADKAEPKFKVGDWIVFNGLILHIDEVVDGYYRTTSIGGIHNSYDWDIDNVARLWTIQDAKDGDVLVGSEWGVILMFRGIGNTEWDDVIDYHCYYDCCRECFIVQEDVGHWGSTKNNQLKPATKEQRDLLFTKMKEAGYELDDEKKELKLLITNGGDFFESENCEQKPAWSEEDKCMLNNVIDTLKPLSQTTHSGYAINSMINWLKSLRPQPKQEWSEEDEKIYSRIYNLIHAAAFENYDVDEDGKELGEYAKITDWLKTLKQRCDWKPSDEQMEALDNARHSNPFDVRILDTLFHDLKKLREE